jgi:branched-chain amino acid transport system permease protein
MSQVVLFNVFNGLIVGAFYALMALGLSLILNLSGVINFAHGGFLALGAYLAYTLIPYIGFWGALIVAPPLTAILGLVIEWLLIRPLYGKDPLYSLLLTFGLAYIFEDVTRLIWGAQSVPFQVPGWLMTSLSSEYFFLTGYRAFMMIIVAVAVGGLLGLSPTIGANLIMPSFVAIILGGLGSLLGTLIGGLMIGVASGLAAVYFPSATEAVIYVMMALVLLVRPRGLLGEEGRLH